MNYKLTYLNRLQGTLPLLLGEGWGEVFLMLELNRLIAERTKELE